MKKGGQSGFIAPDQREEMPAHLFSTYSYKRRTANPDKPGQPVRLASRGSFSCSPRKADGHFSYIRLSGCPGLLKDPRHDPAGGINDTRRTH